MGTGGGEQGKGDGTGGERVSAQGERSQAMGTRGAGIEAAQNAEGALVREEERQAGRNGMGGDEQGEEGGTDGEEARAQRGRSQAMSTRDAGVEAEQGAEGALVRTQERQAGRNAMGKRKWKPAEGSTMRSEEQAAGTMNEKRGKEGRSHEASDGAGTPRNTAIQHSRETQLNTEYREKAEGVKRNREDMGGERRRIWEESAPTRAARWKRYPKLAAVSGAWVAERQDPERRRREAAKATAQYAERYPAAKKEAMKGTTERWIAERLPWPHTWKKRKKAADEQEKARQADEETQRRRAAVEEDARAPRSATRSHLRRTRARSEGYSYDQNPRKRQRQGARTGTKRKIEYIEDVDKRRGALRLTIRAGPEGIRRIVGQRSEEHEAA